MDFLSTISQSFQLMGPLAFFFQSNFNRPLMMPKGQDEADVLSKQQEDSLIARMKMFVHLRQDLERVICQVSPFRLKIKLIYLVKDKWVFEGLY